jgi:hypothetical protein
MKSDMEIGHECKISLQILYDFFVRVKNYKYGDGAKL